MKIASIGKSAEQLKLSYIAAGNSEWRNHFGKDSDVFLNKTCTCLAIPSLSIYPKEIKHMFTHILVYECSEQFYL